MTSTSPKLKVLDLFSGIGGFSLGLERTDGFETVAFCEINAFCRRVLAKHWPEVPCFNDVKTIARQKWSGSKAQTSLRQAFRARTYHSQAKAPDYPESVPVSGGRFAEPFAWYDHASRSWRTWQLCLTGEWERYSGAWPRSGMTRNGIAYRLPPLVPLTGETASGYWPTPDAGVFNLNETPESFLDRQKKLKAKGINGNGCGLTLAVAARMWPTPTAVDGRRGTGTYRPQDTGVPLLHAVAMSFATPTARDWRSGKASAATMSRNSRPLSEQIGGQLNPTWVEWLMGYPNGWTVLPALETPSSRKSRNSSAKPLQTVEETRKCERCNGSGEIVVSTVTLRYVAPGPVPDDAKGVARAACDECRGHGYTERPTEPHKD